MDAGFARRGEVSYLYGYHSVTRRATKYRCAAESLLEDPAARVSGALRGEGFLGEIIFSGLNLFIALFLAALNGLFVAAEFAFVKLRATKVDSMMQESERSAGLIEEATGNLDAYLAVCQLGITVSSLGLGALGEPAIAVLIDPLLAPFLPESLVHAVAFAIGFGIITFLHVVFGELAPKSIAIAKAERTAQIVAPFMKFFYYLFLPGTWVFNGVANVFVRALRIPPASEAEEAHFEDELRVVIRQSTSQGVLEEDEESMLRAVIQLEETNAREIMVPKPNAVALPAHTRLKDLISVDGTENYTRYPIFDSYVLRVDEIDGSRVAQIIVSERDEENDEGNPDNTGG